MIDNLNLFLRVSDNLTNLLIRDLRRADGLDISTVCSLDKSKATNIAAYESFLNHECKISFHFYVRQDSHTLKWRDLNGPEKYRLFSKVNLVLLFPTVPKIGIIQELWVDFMKLNDIIRSDSPSDPEITALKEDARTWLGQFLKVYQTKNVTPYIHTMVSHVREFLQLHGNIVSYTQQGFEMLNDHMTQFYYCGSNHTLLIVAVNEQNECRCVPWVSKRDIIGTLALTTRGGHSHRLYSHNCDRSWAAVNGQSRSKGCSQRSKRVQNRAVCGQSALRIAAKRQIWAGLRVRSKIKG